MVSKDYALVFFFIFMLSYLFSFIFRACYGVVRFVIENGAKGCEVSLNLYSFIVSLHGCFWVPTFLSFL